RNYVAGDTLSSGVLNSAQPLYVDSFYQTAQFFDRIWSSSNMLPVYYYDGSPISYSSVAEVNTDGSYTVYTYSNHDNGYADHPEVAGMATSYTYSGSLWQQVNTGSLVLERGLLLNQADYKSGGTLLKKLAFTYNPDTTRFNNYIRSYHYDRRFSLAGAIISFDQGGFLTLTSGPPIYFGDVVSAYSRYYHYPYGYTLTDTSYDQNGTNPYVKQTTFSYDSYRNKKSEMYLNSMGDTVIQSYNYAADSITGLSSGAQAAKNAMKKNNMVGLVLEKTR
ncbi:MAG: hypothetical protein ABUL46_03305, partial [Chitinophaga rupis]